AFVTQAAPIHASMAIHTTARHIGSSRNASSIATVGSPQRVASVNPSAAQSRCSQRCLSLIMLFAAARRSADAGTFLLDWRAWHRAIGAKHAAITALGPQHLTASLAGIETNACIGRHRLCRLVTAVRARDGGAKL